MKILAVDDEKIALEGLIQAVKEAEPEAEVFGFRKSAQALEFFSQTSCEVAFLDVQLRGASGIDLARQMKLINPAVNIIFATGYGDYREDAFDMHVSGYLMKPITPQKIRNELDNLRYPVPVTPKKRILIRTFGNFELYVDNRPVAFKYEKTKEMLAYLVDRRGAYCNNAEIMAVLWQDTSHVSYLSNLKKDMADTLSLLYCSDLVETARGKMRICLDLVECDYIDWCQGKLHAINQYRGEYMAQYSWAEFTNGELNRDKQR